MKNIIFSTLAILLSVAANSQGWIHYNETGVTAAKAVASDNTSIWVASDGNGLIKKNTGGTWQSYNVSNSNIGDNFLYCIDVDNANKIYCGSSGNGLIVFDGTTFTQQATWNSNLPSNIVQCIDHFNTDIWIGTSAGLCMFNGTTIVNFSSSDIKSLFVESATSLWFGNSSGLTHKNGNIYTNFNTSNSGICDDNVTSITKDNLGNIWVGTTNGLSKLSGSTWTTFNTSNSTIISDDILSLKNQNNQIWIGTSTDGLCKLSSGGFTNYTYPNAPQCFAINDILVDNSNNVWTACDYGGVTKFDGVNWFHYNNDNTSIASDNCYSTNNHNAEIWVCSSAGATQKSNSNYMTFNTSNGLPTNYVFDIDFEGTINWMATNLGLMKVDGSIFTNYNILNSTIISNNTRIIKVDQTGKKWIGASGGISVFDGTAFTNYNMSNSALLANYINEIYVDNSNNVWIATGNGLNKVSATGAWSSYTTINSGLPSNYVKSIAIDGTNNVWLATTNGLSKFDGSTWHTFTTSNSAISSDDINSLDFDMQGNLWIATANDGVCKYNGVNFVSYNTGNSGLFANAVLHVNVDDQNNKWFVLDNSNGVSELQNCNPILNTIHITTCGSYTFNGSTYTNSGSYVHPFTVGNGCDSVVTLNLLLNTIPSINLTVTPNDTLCHGDIVTLLATGANTYSWTAGVQNGIAFSPTASTIYTITATNSAACTNTATQLITVNQLPTISINATPNDSICAGSPLTLTATGASTYTWDLGVLNAVPFYPGGNANYSVLAMDANGCTATLSQNIIINTLPNVVANSNMINPYCYGDTILLYGSGAVSYSWNNGVIDNIPFSSTITSYLVTGTDANGCTSTASPLLTMIYLPTIDSMTLTSSICATDSVYIFASTSVTSDTIFWNSINQNNFFIQPIADTHFVLLVKNMSGCSIDSTITIYITPYLTPLFSIASSISQGATGDTIIYTASTNVPNPYTIEWYRNGILIASSPNNTWQDSIVQGANHITAVLKNSTACMLPDSAVSNLLVINNVTNIHHVTAQEFAVIPNSVSSSFLIKGLKVGSEFIVYNALGQVVMREKVKNEYVNVDVTNLTNGHYFIKSIRGAKSSVVRFEKK